MIVPIKLLDITDSESFFDILNHFETLKRQLTELKKNIVNLVNIAKEIKKLKADYEIPNFNYPFINIF